MKMVLWILTSMTVAMCFWALDRVIRRRRVHEEYWTRVLREMERMK